MRGGNVPLLLMRLCLNLQQFCSFCNLQATGCRQRQLPLQQKEHKGHRMLLRWQLHKTKLSFPVRLPQMQTAAAANHNPSHRRSTCCSRSHHQCEAASSHRRCNSAGFRLLPQALNLPKTWWHSPMRWECSNHYVKPSGA